MQLHGRLPELNRLSILTATIMLAYALTPLITIPSQIFSLSLFRIDFSFQYTFNTIISILVAAFAFIGMAYLLQTHPNFNSKQYWQHSILPALTAWAVGVPLNAIQIGLEWWLLFFFGGLVLIITFTSEFIIVDPEDVRFPPAAIAITAFSFALLFLLTVGARFSQFRLYLLLPMLTVPTFLIVFRTLFLRQGKRWYAYWSMAISLFNAGLTLGLHYLPLSPVTYGLILLATGYGITSLAGNLLSEYPGRNFWIEPVLMCSLFLALSIMIG
jgi:hypothetical protein